MKRMKQWFNQLSVKKKLIYSGYLIISPVLLFICLILLFYNYNKEMNSRLETDIASVNTLADSISVLQSDVKDFSTYICINTEVHNLLTAENVEELNENSKLWLQDAPMQIVQDMISLKGDIKTIAIYAENGVRPYLRGMDGSVYLSDIDELRRTEICQQVLESDNGMIWKYISRNSGEVYETSHTDKVVLFREIFDATQKKTLGFIVIGVSENYFREVCENIIQDEQAGVLVLDRIGNELSRAGTIDEEVESFLKSDDFMKQDYRERDNHFTYGNYDVICQQLEANASIVCKIVPKYSMQMRLLDIVYMPVMLMVGILLALLPLLALISNIVTKPLSQVSEAIYKFSTGDFEQRVEVTTHDEVGEVAECFNRMVEDIKLLIEKNYVITLKEKESELAALQAQINPHFLYNTLDSLYWQAQDAGNEELAETIIALSQLFRLVLSQGKKEVTVGQEIELVSRYLQIQKVRFDKRLNYEIEVEDAVKKAKIPKLIVQPFVENAIVHGFENVSVPCHLSVTGRKVNDYVQFEIRDTGIGMRQDQIDAIFEEEPEKYAKQRVGRFAIKNIKERLQLKYHEDFKLEIQSDVGHGTVVILTVPFEMGDKSVN